MENKKDTETEIVCSEFYGDSCLSDSSVKPIPKDRKPVGRVHIYEDCGNGKKKLIHKSNIVVYLGREMLAQRLVNTENALVRPTKDEFVSWFGLGEGGVDPADPLDPTPPVIDDEDLSQPVMLTNSTPTSYGAYHNAGDIDVNTNVTYPKTGYYRKTFDSVEFEIDTVNDNRYLVIKITTTIGSIDANGEQVSEAGLYSASSVIDSYNGNFSLFARVTYPTLIKTSARRLIFVWYLYV
jgi:hypothetical protein